MRRAAVSTALVIAMALFGIGTYGALASLRGSGAHIKRPSSSLVTLPGTLYLAQAGAIYRLHGGAFKQITPEEGWTQPAASPDGSHLVAVKRSINASDVYVLGIDGQERTRLTSNGSKPVEANHWAFYPRFSPDGSTVFFSYDSKDPYNSYRVDLSIVSVPANPPAAQPTPWTQPNPYTGGDVSPLPVNQGLIFTRYSIDVHAQVHSQVWLKAGQSTPGVALTPLDDDCAQPSLSADGKLLAMVCRHGQLRTADLVVASFDSASSSIGNAITLVSGKLVASPAFSSDGLSIAYLAPDATGGQFQLWSIPSTAGGAEGSPRQITQSLGFDSTSAPVWLGS